MTTAIIGAGIAGLCAADGLRRAGRDTVVYDSRPSWGGHTSSDCFAGHWFDEGPHLSFTRDERVRSLFARGAEAAGGAHELPARITNRFEGHWVEHPAQVNLRGLPADLVTACLVDKAEAVAHPADVRTYADWLVGMYGRTFAETFPFRYTRKYWTVEPDQLGLDWIGPRMQQPSLAEMVRGALDPPVGGDFHYLSSYRYPVRGGFASFLGDLDPGGSLRGGREVVAVDVREKRLRFADGSSEEYSELVSTMPLDVLVGRLEGIRVPHEVREAAAALLCTSVVLVDVCVNRSDLFDHEWFYVYDEDVSFARAHLPSLLAPGMSPPGQGSVQVEVYHSRRRPLTDDPDALVARVVRELVGMGILRDADEVLAARARNLSHANVVFDHARADALAAVKAFVAEQGIVLAGRYGEWEYQWTDDAARSGWRAAAAVVGTDVEPLLAGQPR